jgi:hypothetical protein
LDGIFSSHPTAQLAFSGGFCNSVGIEVNDLHDENALVTEPREIVVIDPVPMMEEASKLTRLKAWGNQVSGAS